MAAWAYGITLFISIAILLWMAMRNYESTDRYYWTVVILIPIVILGYWLKTMVVTEEAARILFCFIYLDSTVLLSLMIFLMLRSIGIRPRPWIRILVYGAALLHLLVVWLTVRNGLYFKQIEVIPSPGGTITKVAGGPLRIGHFIYLGIILAAIIAVIILGFVRKGHFSHRSLVIYAALAGSGILLYAVEWLIDISYSLLPFLYVISEFLIALQYDRIIMHDISQLVAEHQEEHGTRGFVAFDSARRFVSCNAVSTQFFPELEGLRVDAKLPKESSLRAVFYSMIDALEKRGDTSQKFQIAQKTCVCEVNTFSFNKYAEKQGFLFEIRDATEEQKAMDIVTSYNERLNEEVEEKTRNILEMQNKLVTGMANMIENRDNNTGGHVKRTSDIIRILIDEIRKEGHLSIGKQLANDIVRAAPMHDLGKISIENAILNKPEKLTDEEYEIMKTHAAKSGEMVLILLDGVEEDHFVRVAFNVARYHHERWDGRGYPEGLAGTMIPVEARVMAVADVYDALACKRSYKEALDPALVARIMCEGMGTQFDPAMLPVFLACRKKLEEYYQKNM